MSSKNRSDCTYESIILITLLIQGGDEKNINGNSINEGTEEKINTLKGSNPLSEKNMSKNPVLNQKNIYE